jgi:hypothetical protein
MLAFVHFALLCALALAPAAETAEPRETPRTTVLIELFTSEGCSSCPAADEQIARLVRVQPLKQVRIIALSEHVDYWNGLGWVDPFSSAAFTDRQRAYGKRFATEVYTPQLVVDGSQHVVGSNADDTMTAIYRAAGRPKVALELTPAVEGEGSIGVEVTMGSLPVEITGEFVLWAAVAEDGLVVEASRGENVGRTLRHDGVARRLENLGSIEPGETRRVEIALDPAWNRDKLSVVAFLERKGDGRIVGVAATP